MKDDRHAYGSPPALGTVLILIGLSAALTLVIAALPEIAVGSLVPPSLPLSPFLLGLLLGGAALLALFAVLRSRVTRARAEDVPTGSLPSPSRLASANHRTITVDRPKTRFADVAGVEEAKEDLEEVVEFLRAPAKFSRLGARIPRGVLLVGPPGTGKTLLARAVAGEAGVPFMSATGSEFVELYVGVGASRVRSLFHEARKLAPCIMFIDEIDAVGRKRGGSFGVAHEEREQTLNQLLVEMDGFDQRTNIIVLAATNRVDVLDEALLRPGRFDRQVQLDLPDSAGRHAILSIHARGKPIADPGDLQEMARLTAGLSGADLENLLNEAAILAARRDRLTIGRDELEEALDRITAGPRRKSRVLSEREREISAHHEIGHALVAWALPHADRPHKVTVVARGLTGGHTRIVPEEDRTLWSKSEFEAAIATALGGHVVEELLYGEVTTGPSSDLQRATEIARRMVTEFGMSSQIGPLVFSARSLWGEGPDYRAYGEHAARRIEAEVREVVQRARERARAVLQKHWDVLLCTARELKEQETLTAAQLERLFAPVRTEEQPVGEALPSASDRSTPPPARRRRRDPSLGRPYIAAQRLAMQRFRRR